jgi:F-type H+-transporting ATPase subunit gamma
MLGTKEIRRRIRSVISIQQITRAMQMIAVSRLKKAEEYEKWEDVDFDGVYETERSFEVEEEDIKAYSEGILDDNPLFNDKEAAKNGPSAV